jgi:LysR family transcriptional activator of nhaA
MEWLNYHHLLYFWTVARKGGLAAAAAELHLSPPTVSVQVRRLEEALDERLFQRAGRRLVLTEVGSVVYRFADEIFSLGRDLVDTLKGRPTGRPLRLVVGVADVLPKIVAHRLIAPVLRLPEPVRVVCREASPEQLLAALAGQQLDVLLTDTPVGAGFKVRAHSHLLGESGMSFLGVPALVKALRRGFPGSLSDAPILLPTENMAVRRGLDEWFESNAIRPRTVGEFEDHALLQEFAVSGHGIMAAPAVVERPLRRTYRLELLGRVTEVRAQFYAVSLERRIKNPAVAVMCDSARAEVFVR